MYPVFILVLLSSLGVFIATQANHFMAEYRDYQGKREAAVVQKMGKTARRFYEVNGYLPSSLKELTGNDGHPQPSHATATGGQLVTFPDGRTETISQLSVWQTAPLNVWEGYAASATSDKANAVNDGTVRYQRMTYFAQPRPPAGVDATNSSYSPAYGASSAAQTQLVSNFTSAANNACSTTGQDFNTAQEWCAANQPSTSSASPLNSGQTVDQLRAQRQAYWSSFDERSAFPRQMEEQSGRQQRLMHRFAGLYNTMGQFPVPPSSAGNSAPLTTLANYTGTAANCTTPSAWMINGGVSLALDCGDLYSVWGTPVYYYYIDQNNMALVTKANINDYQGYPVYVVTDVHL